MAGVLLAAGPIATLNSVKKSSRIFLFSVSKSKFEAAANRLQALNLGTLQYLYSGQKAPIWVKKSPAEVATILAQGGCEDLCSLEEYAERFALPCPMSVTGKMKDAVVAMGWVARELFVDYQVTYKSPKSGSKRGISQRFGSGNFPTIRNIMAGILLLQGPVATSLAVKQSSRIFLFALNKSKFELAANKLQALNLGSLVYLHGKKVPVFIKKLPFEIGPFLARPECQDFCTLEEYTERFQMVPPKSITNKNPKLMTSILEQGLVAPELFHLEPVQEAEAWIG